MENKAIKAGVTVAVLCAGIATYNGIASDKPIISDYNGLRPREARTSSEAEADAADH